MDQRDARRTPEKEKLAVKLDVTLLWWICFCLYVLAAGGIVILSAIEK
jgi:hypothetical protein